MNNKDRIGWIDSAKGISIFMIVAGHCADKSGADNILLHLCMFTGVGVFFLLAGMTFCDRCTGKNDEFPWFDDRPFSEFIRELWHRMIIPYLFWSMLSILIYAAAGRTAARILHSDRHNFSIGKNILGMLWANSGTGYMEWNRPLWFLPCLTVVELIWFLVLKAMWRIKSFGIRKVLYAAVMTASLIWLLGTAFAGIRLRLPWETETALSVLGYFGAGRLIRHSDFNNSAKIPMRPSDGEHSDKAVFLVLSIVFLAIEIILLWRTKYADFRADRFSSPTLLIPDMAVGAAAVILAARSMENSKPLHYIGKRTMAILVMHKFPIMAFKVLSRLPGLHLGSASGNGLPALTMTVAADLAAAVLSIALCLIAEKIISRFIPEVFGRSRRIDAV